MTADTGSIFQKLGPLPADTASCSGGAGVGLVDPEEPHPRGPHQAARDQNIPQTSDPGTGEVRDKRQQAPCQEAQ